MIKWDDMSWSGKDFRLRGTINGQYLVAITGLCNSNSMTRSVMEDYTVYVQTANKDYKIEPPSVDDAKALAELLHATGEL